MRIIKTISARSGLAFINQQSGVGVLRAALYWLVLLTILWVGQMAAAYAATPPNTELLNTVYATYQVGAGAPVNMQASVRTVTTDRTPAQIDFYTVFEGGELTHLPNTDYSLSGSDANPQWQPVTHDLAASVPISQTSSFAAGQTLLIRLEDFDQNIDSGVSETIIITLVTLAGDREVLRLTETAPDSGVFLGAILTSASASSSVHNGSLSVDSAAEITASYRDQNDVADTVAAAVVIDPISRVFDSTTGAPISGAQIKLVHDKSGLNARIYDTDGSDWPNPVVSGQAHSARIATRSLPLKQGEFRFPRVPAGEYRLEVIPPPGYRYPSQQSNAQLAALGMATDKVVIGARGERFTLEKALDTVNFNVPLDPFTGRFSVTKTVVPGVAAVGDIVKYVITATNRDTHHSLRNVVLHDKLPPGFRYIAQSARYSDGKVFPADQIQVEGRQLHFKPGQLAAGESITLSYLTHVGVGSQANTNGVAVNQVQGFSDDAVSDISRAEVRLLDELMTHKSLLIGRVFSGSCEDVAQQTGIRDARLYLQNGRSVVTDNNGRWHMAGVPAGTHVVQLDKESMPAGYRLAPCRMTARHAGKPFAQWVDVIGGDIQRIDFRLQPDGTGSTAKPAGKAASTGTAQPDDPLLQFGPDYVARTQPGFAFVWPPARYVPAISSVKIAVKHPPKHKLTLLLNGEKVSPLNFKGSHTNKAKTVTVARWSGVDIKQKHNVLTAIIRDKAGREVQRLERQVHFTERSVRANLVESESRLIADGKQRPVITLRLEDEEGYTPRPRTHGYFSLEHAHWTPVQSAAAATENVALNTRQQNGRYEYTVSNDGLVRIELEPTARSGEVAVNIALSNGETATVRAWLQPALRDWIMVGFAKGTLGYKTLAGNLQTLADGGQQEGYYRKGQLSFFAKGRVRGDYLLTIAYDSAKQVGETGAQLLDGIDPNEWYTLYADQQSEQYEAPSSHRLYLKLEKEQFFALFGDFYTDLDITELSSYERVLSGLKSEYKGDNWNYKVFASQTGNQRQRDQLLPDGTSGPYVLSYEPIRNSEKVVIETRDRDHPEVIVASRTLTRHVDYEIDYLQRSLRFKFPVSSGDHDFNPTFIIAHYEVISGKAGKELTAGGRLAYTSDDERLTAGVSYLREGDESQQYGVDARYQVGEHLTLRAEMAQSGKQEKALAWLAEADYATDDFNIRAYGREKEQGFGLQKNQAAQSIHKLGLETRYALALDSVLSFDINRQVVAGTRGAVDTERLQADIQWEKEFDSSQFSFGVRHAEEDSGVGQQQQRHVIVGGQTRLFDDKVTLSAKLEKSLGDAASQKVPDRARFGLEYQLSEDTELALAQEWSQLGEEQAYRTRFGLRTKPWAGGRINSGVTREETVGDDIQQRDYANFGLSQQWQVNENLSLDASVEQVKTLHQLKDSAAEDETPTVDNSDYSVFSVGAGWNDQDWSAAGRIEHLAGAVSDKQLLTLGVVRELSADHALAANARITDVTQSDGSRTRKSEVGLHAAARPAGQGNWLNRLDFIDESKRSQEAETTERKAIYNLHYVRPLGEKAEFSFHYGVKLGLLEDETGRYRSLLDTMQAAVRLDVTEQWDAGLQGGYLHNWESNTWNYFAGVAVGFSPSTNTRVEAGYNLSGFEDEDFNNTHHTHQGPYINFNYKLDQDLMDEVKAWSER